MAARVRRNLSWSFGSGTAAVILSMKSSMSRAFAAARDVTTFAIGPRYAARLRVTS